MPRHRALCSSFALGTVVILSCGCSTVATADGAVVAREPDAERGAIEAVLRGYERAYAAGDAVALAALHTEDGGYWVPTGEVVRGRAALARFWQGRTAPGLELALEAWATGGDVGWAAGRWSFANRGPDGPHGRFVLGLRRNAVHAFEIVVDLNNEAPRRGG